MIHWNKQEIEPQPLTDIQENTLKTQQNTMEVKRLRYAVYFLIMMIGIVLAYVLLDRTNIIWGILIR